MMIGENKIILAVCLVLCAISCINCACESTQPANLPSTVTVPPSPSPPVTLPAFAQWVSIGNLKITNQAQVLAFLTANCSRTTQQQELVTSVINGIIAKLTASGINIIKISQPTPIYGLDCPSAGKRQVGKINISKREVQSFDFMGIEGTFDDSVMTLEDVKAKIISLAN